MFIVYKYGATKINEYLDCIDLTHWGERRIYPDSKVNGANMGPIWGRQDPGGPHVDPMNFAIWLYVSKITIVGSDNGLSPGQRQAISWTNAGIRTPMKF